MRLKLAWLPGEGHYRVRVFVGVDADHLALAGQLTLDPAEAFAFRRVVERGVESAAIFHWLAEQEPMVGELLQLERPEYSEWAEAGWVEPDA